MLSSILSLYIASTIQPQLHSTASLSHTEPPALIKTASVNLASLSSPLPPPQKNPYYISPIIEAQTGMAIDLKTGAVLFEKKPHERRPMASITKLMTLLIILEENELSEIVTISQKSAITEGSTMFLRQNEKITVENLIYGTLIHSANDAAVALAEHNAGTTAAFVEKMNKKALELGMINTHFANPTGLDQPQNYSSAYDLTKLAQYVYQYELIKEAAQLREMTVKSENGNYVHVLKTTNDLLDSFLKMKGLKTGRTEAAGLCLVGIAENKDGHEVLTVLLDSPARFQETKILMEWIFRAYTW